MTNRIACLLDAFTPDECANYFCKRGYASPNWKMLGGTAEKVHPPGGAHDGRWLDVIAHG
jgi:hypothetical protein